MNDLSTSARPQSARRLLLRALLGAPLVLGLAACGRKGNLRPPEGREGEYTFPHRYPAYKTVLPNIGEEPESGEEAGGESSGESGGESGGS